MVVTAFLSMWLNNTATTAMMMPIAHAVLKELDDNRKRQMELRNVKTEPPTDPDAIGSYKSSICFVSENDWMSLKMTIWPLNISG